MEIRMKSTGQVMFEDEFRRWAKENGGHSWKVITDDVLHSMGADPVFEGPQATGGTVYQFSMRQGVEQQSDGKWYTKYVLGPIFTDLPATDTEPAMTAAEQEAAYKSRKDAEQAENVRRSRNQMLDNCDWTQLADSPVDKSVWAEYRQALRDVPLQEGFPWTVEWPINPNEQT